jgi:hypothetical protein
MRQRMKYADLEARCLLLGDRLRSSALPNRQPPSRTQKGADLRLSLKQTTVDNARLAHRDADLRCRQAIGTSQHTEARAALIAAAIALDLAKRQQATLIAEHSRSQPAPDPEQIHRQIRPALNEAISEICVLLALADLICDGIDSARASLPSGVPARALTGSVAIRGAIRQARAVANGMVAK